MCKRHCSSSEAPRTLPPCSPTDCYYNTTLHCGCFNQGTNQNLWGSYYEYIDLVAIVKAYWIRDLWGVTKNDPSLLLGTTNKPISDSYVGQWVRRLNYPLFNPIEDSFTARRTLGVQERGSLTWRTPAGARPATRPYGARGLPTT